jgi:hypothetical protein
MDIFPKMIYKRQTRTRRARHQWLIPIILATWEAELGRIKVQGQLGQILQETLSPK